MTTKIIREQIVSITQHPSFIAWFKSVKSNPSDLIAINSSFIFRQDVKTVKNPKHLALKIGKTGKIHTQPVIIEGVNFNSDFKLIKIATLKSSPIKINEAMTGELKNLGLLVLILIGEVQDNIKLEQDVDHGSISKLYLDPTSKQNATVAQLSLTVNDTSDEEAIWQELVRQFNGTGRSGEVDQNLRHAIGVALDEIEKDAYALLVLPTKRPSDDTIIDSIINVLKQQRLEYKNALDLSNGEKSRSLQGYNELLRIAYNFSSDAIALLRLIVRICDLKPLVLWGTISHHYYLSEAFRALPWSRSRNKPPLKNYIQTIADARNSAFHNAFPFRKSLHVDLPGKALSGLSLRIFSSYPRRKENNLRYEDKELVEVLTEFTRAGERQVSSRFWHQNLQVIDETIALFDATKNLLVSTFK